MSVGRASRAEHVAHVKAARQREACLLFPNPCAAHQALVNLVSGLYDLISSCHLLLSPHQPHWPPTCTSANSFLPLTKRALRWAPGLLGPALHCAQCELSLAPQAQDGAAFGGTMGSDLQCNVFRRLSVVVRVEEGILESVGI